MPSRYSFEPVHCRLHIRLSSARPLGLSLTVSCTSLVRAISSRSQTSIQTCAQRRCKSCRSRHLPGFPESRADEMIRHVKDLDSHSESISLAEAAGGGHSFQHLHIEREEIGITTRAIAWPHKVSILVND